MGDIIINKVPAEAFLIKDESLKKADAAFYKWLRENSFRYAWSKGHYGMDLVFVNITHKLYVYGMPGVEIVKPIGNHAITIDEFMSIYNIYSGYTGMRINDL